MLVPIDVEIASTLACLRPLLEPKMSELASAMGATITELNQPHLTGGAPFHYIYQNFDSYSFRTTLCETAASSSQLAQRSTSSSTEPPIKFTKEISAYVDV